MKSDLDSIDVVFGRDDMNVPDGSTLYLNDLEANQIGDIIIQALQNDSLSLIADTSPVSIGPLASASHEVGSFYAQFEGLRVITNVELNIIVLPEG